MPAISDPRILVADDQRDVREALRLLLKGEGCTVETVSSPGAVLEAIASRDYDLILMDLNYTRDTTSGREGLDLLRRIRQVDAEIPVVAMTAWGTIDIAVEAMRSGAQDFIEKPWDNVRLTNVVCNQIALARALRKGDRLARENSLLRGEVGDSFVAASPAMQSVLQLLDRVAPSDAGVLVTGENGTGKGLVAQLVHERSPRAEAPFITVNMGGVPGSLFESELFGHEKGAFTDARSERVGRFELADGGTLFLDEIANVPLDQQAKLLRVLESGEFERVGSSRTRKVDVRVLCATNADLPRMVEEGGFRKDLYFRLNTVEIRLPPLREHREDIPVLAERFLRTYQQKYGRELEGLEDAALDALVRYDWPGNVRELDHVMERAVLLTSGSRIGAKDLRLELGPGGGEPIRLEDMSLDDAERILIRNALDRYSGNVNRAADALGLSRSALYRRIEKYGL